MKQKSHKKANSNTLADLFRLVEPKSMKKEIEENEEQTLKDCLSSYKSDLENLNDINNAVVGPEFENETRIPQQHNINYGALTYTKFMEITKFNKSTKFCKMLNNELCHFGFQYQIGLNIDTVEFNPSGICETGGLYFTTDDHIASFYGHGLNYATVKLCEDAMFYIDPLGQSFKTTKFIIVDYEQKYDHCVEAVKQNPWNIRFVISQTEDLCKYAICTNPWILKFVNNECKTNNVCLLALILNNRTAEHMSTEMYKKALLEIDVFDLSQDDKYWAVISICHENEIDIPQYYTDGRFWSLMVSEDKKIQMDFFDDDSDEEYGSCCDDYNNFVSSVREKEKKNSESDSYESEKEPRIKAPKKLKRIL